jgi:hypothetical protein
MSLSKAFTINLEIRGYLLKYASNCCDKHDLGACPPSIHGSSRTWFIPDDALFAYSNLACPQIDG